MVTVMEEVLRALLSALRHAGNMERRGFEVSRFRGEEMMEEE
jgi:hypothetical protein